MQARGELAVICEECKHKNVVDLTGHSRNVKTFDGQRFVGTRADNLTDVRNLRKPWQPPSLSAPSWFAPGTLLGLAATGTLALAGVHFSAGTLLGTALTTSCVGMLVYNQLGQYRARKPRTKKVRTTVTVKSESGDDDVKLDFECDIRALRTFAAKYVEAGGQMSTAEDSWVGGGNPLTRAQHKAIRDGMIATNRAAWNSDKGKSQGWRIKGQGGAFLRAFAPPTPRA